MSLREDYAEAFGAFEGVVKSAVHDGAFTTQELQRLGGSASRSVYTTRLSLVVSEEGREDRTLFGAYVFCRRGGAVDSEADVAWLLARRVAHHVTTEGAIRVKARNVFNATTASRGFTAWAVTWEVEEPDFDAAALDAELAELRSIHTDFVHDGRELPAGADAPLDPLTDGDTAVTVTTR